MVARYREAHRTHVGSSWWEFAADRAVWEKGQGQEGKPLYLIDRLNLIESATHALGGGGKRIYYVSPGTGQSQYRTKFNLRWHINIYGACALFRLPGALPTRGFQDKKFPYMGGGEGGSLGREKKVSYQLLDLMFNYFFEWSESMKFKLWFKPCKIMKAERGLLIRVLSMFRLMILLDFKVNYYSDSGWRIVSRQGRRLREGWDSVGTTAAGNAE
ncbi:hypothetical protein FB451DRAFT_1508582 [Mycena latifolia]|nr:hypothetical protein FB451DRAFT_1508582 [Mycena latifolia]